MSGYIDALLVVVLLSDLYLVYTSRLGACVKATAVQGVALALLPVLRFLETPAASELVHVLVMASGALLFKAILVPWLLFRAMRDVATRRDVEPFVSTHLSVLFAGALVGVSFWLASLLALPGVGRSSLFGPTAFSTMLIGFLLLVSRRKALTQVGRLPGRRERRLRFRPECGGRDAVPGRAWHPA